MGGALSGEANGAQRKFQEMKEKRPVHPDVAAVMAGNPILAWRAGWSLMMSAMSVAVLVEMALLSMVNGLVESAGKLVLCLFVYGFLWFAGLAYGGGEVADGAAEPAEPFRGVFALRAVMFALGFSLLAWSPDSGLWVGEAVMTAGFWTGALVESGWVERAATDRGFSFWKGLRVSLRVAALGSRKAFGVMGEVERDG